MDQMATMTKVIEHLRASGYTEDFNAHRDGLLYSGLQKVLHDEFVIDKFYRFEGESDPADEATVYAISCPRHHIKGILVNGAGIYTDELTDEMLAALEIKRQ